MSKLVKKVLKLALDLLLIISFAVMYKKKVISMSFHEIAGLIILGVTAIHLAINFRWVIGITKKVFSKAFPIRTRIAYLIDLALILCLIMMIITSLLISEKVQLFGIGGEEGIWKDLHFFTSAVMLILMGVHLGLHFKYISTTLKLGEIGSAILLAIVLLISIFGIYSLAESDFGAWLAAPFAASESHELEEGHGLGQGKGLHDGSGKGEATTGGFLLVLMQYSSILIAFASATFLLDALFRRRKLIRKE